MVTSGAKRSHLTANVKALAASLRHGAPAKKIPVIAVAGSDGGITTVAFLAQILRTAGERVGIITQDFIEIAGQHVKGSDQAHPIEDPFRLQQLLAQMARAKCRYVLLALPPVMPVHQFRSVPFSLLVVRRISDIYQDKLATTAAVEYVQSLLTRNPGFVVMLRDDPAFVEAWRLTRPEAHMSYGTVAEAESRMTKVNLHPKGSMVRLVIDHQTTLDLTSRLTSKQTIYSLAAAATAAYALHVPLEHIIMGVTKLPPQPAMCEFLALDRPYQVVLDSSTTPQGIAEVLESLKHFAKNRLIVVLSTSLAQSDTWRPVVGEVVAEFADRIIVTNGDYTNEESPQVVRSRLLEGISRAGKEAIAEELGDRDKALEKAFSVARRGDIIVVCAATTRPYRQVGADRLPWNDAAKIKALF